MFKALCCCCCCYKSKKKEIKEPLIKIEDLYDEAEPKYRTLSEVIENKKVDWSVYEEPESKEDYYRMLGEAEYLKQKFIGK
jgi:hypothetical protein